MRMFTALFMLVMAVVTVTESDDYMNQECHQVEECE